MIIVSLVIVRNVARFVVHDTPADTMYAEIARRTHFVVYIRKFIHDVTPLRCVGFYYI